LVQLNRVPLGDVTQGTTVQVDKVAEMEEEVAEMEEGRMAMAVKVRGRQGGIVNRGSRSTVTEMEACNRRMVYPS
jgi:hypothetical protein